MPNRVTTDQAGAEEHLNRDLWNNFLEKPVALNHLSTDSILEMFAKELALGAY